MHKHAHNKEGMAGVIRGLQTTRWYGAKHGARHKRAKERALKKARGEEIIGPF